MTSNRKTALVAGVLFIITFVAGIAAAILYGPAVDDPAYIIGPGADSRVLLGGMFEVITIIANLGTALVLFSILKRQNEGVSLGYVTARIMECALMALGLVALLTVVTLRQDPAGPDASTLVTVGESLVSINRWTFLLGPGFVAGVGNGLLLGYLMYRSALVPRRMAWFGLIGGPLLAASGIAVLLGVIPQGSTLQGIATIPEIIWEAFLGLYLTFVGFRASRLSAAESPEVQLNAGRAAA